MDVSTISSASVSLSARSQLSAPLGAHDVEKGERAHQPHRHEHSHGKSERAHALNAYRQEVRLAIRSSFRAQFAINQSSYAAIQGEPTADDVALEALGAAKQLVAAAPTSSGEALVSFRSKIEESAVFVKQALATDDDVSGIDDAVARIDSGIAELEAEVAQNQESVATALEINTQSKQRSTIKILTQEGDLVKLSLKRSDSFSASDTTSIEDGISSSTTEIEISSRSRLTLSVEGDLNDTELAAIQNVFAQAESIANEFFGGDIAAAFELAAGFEFDTEQLARVKLGFRSYQSSSVAYTETTRVTPAIAAPGSRPPEPTAGTVAPIEEVAIAPTVSAPDEAVVPIEPATESPPAAAPVDTTALSDFFGLISDFLRSVGSGFDASADSSSSSIKFHYSESFKLTLLSAVVNAAAPDDSADAASGISSTIEAIAGITEQEQAAAVAS